MTTTTISPTQQYQACIDACVRCAQACEFCHDACLREEDGKRMAECIRLDKECAQNCWTAASYMSGGSRFTQAICRICASICQECGEECAKHEMEHCQRCAEACQQCMDECRKMAA